ncbi:MAG: hypothetical protein WC878_03930 [Candidatus Paceibacterota bacterium]|jgi:hypothetical protein
MELKINKDILEGGNDKSTLSLVKELFENHGLNKKKEKSQEAADLQSFLLSEEGKSALETLKKTGKHVGLAMTESGANCQTKYGINKDGLYSETRNLNQGNEWAEMEHCAEEEMFRDLRSCDNGDGFATRNYPCPDAELADWIREEIAGIKKTLPQE